MHSVGTPDALQKRDDTPAEPTISVRLNPDAPPGGYPVARRRGVQRTFERPSWRLTRGRTQER